VRDGPGGGQVVCRASYRRAAGNVLSHLPPRSYSPSSCSHCAWAFTAVRVDVPIAVSDARYGGGEDIEVPTVLACHCCTCYGKWHTSNGTTFGQPTHEGLEIGNGRPKQRSDRLSTSTQTTETRDGRDFGHKTPERASMLPKEWH
jgi:hypothetical protein